MADNQFYNFPEQILKINAIPAISNLLEVVCNTTGMGFAAVARVTDTQWIACAVQDKINFGLVPGGELKLESTICNEIREHHQVVVIDHVAENDLYRDHHTPAMYGFQSYISVPITLKNGEFFGTLCAIDPRPAVLNTPEIIGMFNLFAELIAFHLDALEKIERSESLLVKERKESELREQFIAILGHDLRNPIAAISNAAQLQLKSELDQRNFRLANIIQDAAYRTKVLIDNMLDFASGRLGGGIVLDFDNQKDLKSTIKQVVRELNTVWPDRNIQLKLDFVESINSDNKRIAQLLSNLLANAITHGDQEKVIEVEAFSIGNEFHLVVSNSGNKIPDEALERLFHPFSRGGVKNGQQGLGLGLFIASEIASAHQGVLKVESDDSKTSFTFSMTQA